MITFFGALALPVTSSALAQPERYAGSYLWWLVGAGAAVAVAWGYLAWSGARSVFAQKPTHEEGDIPEDRNPDLL